MLEGRDITGLNTSGMLKAGINLVPEDRHNHGLFKISAVSENITASMLDRKDMGRFTLNRKKEKQLTSKYVEDFRIKVTDNGQLA